jgi:energy-coupling factor transporter ATP-binding protein EcfA2
MRTTRPGKIDRGWSHWIYFGGLGGSRREIGSGIWSIPRRGIRKQGRGWVIRSSVCRRSIQRMGMRGNLSHRQCYGLGADWSSGKKRSWDAALFDGIHWPKILNLARQYKIRPMMAATLREAGWPHVPAEIRSAMEKDERASSIRTMRQLQLLGELAAQANALGLRVFAMKGVALSLHLYKDPFIREAYDLDFLVHPEDIVRFDELLLAAGCKPEEHGPQLSAKQEKILARFLHHRKFYQTETGVVVERHHVFYQNTHSIRTDFDALWEAREWVAVGKEQVPILGNTDLIHFLGVHASRHGWERWKWIADQAMLLRRLDAASLTQARERARQEGNHNLFDSWLLLVSWLAGWPSPPAPVESAARNRYAWLLDGVDLRSFDPEVLHRQIAILFQEPVRYQATVAENIAFGDVDGIFDKERVQQAAQAAGAQSLTEGLPDGFDALLGKWFGGAELSGGEWQRIALARTFFRHASLIILDEPTSVMDSWAEQDWLRRFRRLTENKTGLMITHRFTTAMYADIIHVLDKGRVVESGTHAELVILNGAYARSWRMQMQEAQSRMSGLADKKRRDENNSG